MDAAAAAIAESIAQARKVYAQGHGGVLAVLKDADSDLAERLKHLANKPGAQDRFSHASADLYRRQIGIVTTYLEKRLAGHTHEQAEKAVSLSVKATVKVAKKLEAKFTGITRPLAIESQQRQDHLIHGQSSSLLRRHQSSFNRYGKMMVGDFERAMRAGVLQGLTQEQMISKLVSAGKAGGHTAQSLHENEPQHFPEPTGYVRKRYWAERIVRTEVAHAYNGAALATMYETRNTEFPDLQKKILATFDMRTAPDSVAVHGQVRPLDGYFTDGAGRTYQHPPARPNDRETVIPWRPHWKETEQTSEPSPEVKAEAQVEAAPSPLGEPRKKSLAEAVAAAKAKIVAKQQVDSAQKAQLAAFSTAQSKAQAALKEGQVALGHAVVADAKALEKALAAGKPALPVGTGYQAALEKAKAYKAEQLAAAKLKAEAEALARAEKLKAEGAAAHGVWSTPGVFHSAQEAVGMLKGIAKSNPKLFGEVYQIATGKPAAGAIGKIGNPLQLGKITKELTQKLQPALEFPKPKAKGPALSPEQALAEKKAALLAPNVDLKVAAAAFTDAEIHAVLKGNPLVLPGEVEEVLAMSATGKAAYLHQVAKEWEDLKADAKLADLKEQPSGGKNYVDVYQGGKKVAFYYKEGTTEAPSYVVKPPPALADTHPQQAFSEKHEATAYAIEVGKKVALDKELGISAAKQAAAAAAAKPKTGMLHEPLNPASMQWSKAYQPEERPAVELHSSPANDVSKNLKADRFGHHLALDEDWIEGLEVHFSQEKISGGALETVVRFKVTEHRAAEVEKNLKGQKVDAYYHRIENQQADELAKSGATRKVADAQAWERQVGTAKVRLYRSNDTSGGDLAANHNLVEMRFPGTPKDAMEQALQGFRRLGIKAERPSAEILLSQKRAAIMAKLDPDSARELKSLKDRSAKSLSAVWEKSVLRNPKLAEIEADAELRQIGHGKQALYSNTLAKMYQDAGVTFLEHDMNPGSHKDGLEAVRQIVIQSGGQGLLSSRERYQRGLFVEGQSTSRDFETGGADSVFTRLRTVSGTDKRSQWTFELDPSELGRLDTYAFNGDNYGAAGPNPKHAMGGLERQTAAELMELARRRQLSHSNELMLQRQVPASSIRRIVAKDGTIRKETLELFKQAGLTHYNGVPIEEFVVTSSW